MPVCPASYAVFRQRSARLLKFLWLSCTAVFPNSQELCAPPKKGYRYPTRTNRLKNHVSIPFRAAWKAKRHRLLSQTNLPVRHGIYYHYSQLYLKVNPRFNFLFKSITGVFSHETRRIFARFAADFPRHFPQRFPAGTLKRLVFPPFLVKKP